MRQSNPNQAPRRKLIPNLFSSILKVIAESDRPLTQHEIVEAVSKQLQRSDEELKRQITVNLHDALIYGYLRVKDFRYSIVPNRLDPNEPRQEFSSDQLVQPQADVHSEHDINLNNNGRSKENTIGATSGGSKRQTELHSTTQQS